jgi:hypothetical protein
LFFSLLQCLEHVSGLGDMREVDLRPGSRVGAQATRSARPEPLEVSAHTFGFVEFERTRMCLFLCNADVVENIQNCPALNFQFAR